MKTQKQFFFLLLIAVLICTAIACFRTGETNVPENTSVPGEAPTEPTDEAEQVVEIDLITTPSPSPTPEPTEIPTPEPTPTPSPTPEPTPTPAPTPDGLLGGRYDGFYTGEGHVKTDMSYKSDTVSIEVTRYDSSPLTKHLVYFVTDIHIQNIEALRTESWDGKFGTSGNSLWASFLRMSRNAQAIVAINGDYYTYNIRTGLVIRNGERYAPDPWKPWPGHQILLLYRDGTVAVFDSDTFDPETTDLSDVWQAWEFGPSLLDENGAARNDFHKAYHDIDRANPRTVFGYYEPGHYCFVTIDGRKSGYSNGLTLGEEAKLMESLGCKVAFNLDGGQTSQFYWNDSMFNVPYKKGRSTSDIIYVIDPESDPDEPVYDAMP